MIRFLGQRFPHLELLQNVEQIGKNIASLKIAAQKAGIPVVYVNDNFDKWKSDFRHVIEYVQQEDKPGRFENISHICVFPLLLKERSWWTYCTHTKTTVCSMLGGFSSPIDHPF